MGVLKPSIDLFGSMAVRLGFCTEENVEECLQVQRDLKERGQLRPIGELLLDRRHLTASQQKHICRALGIYTGPIPGFQVVRKLGQGGMGCVYLAKDGSGRLVAVKLISTLATESGTYGQRLMQEAEQAALIRHPGLVSPIRAESTEDAYYLIMEYFESRNTREVVAQDGPMASPAALAIARQVAAGLVAVGKHGIVHGDVKPENVLLNATGTAKLCDFGVSRRLDSRDPTRRRFGGTPAFAAPEALLGEEADLRADQYSLGATIFFWVTGRRAFEPPPSLSKGSSTRFFLAQVHQDGPDPRPFAPALDDRFAAVILRMLKRDRRERYASPEAVEQALAAL